MSNKVTPINDAFSTMSLEELQDYIVRTSEILKETKSKRNFVQQERELINSYYEISKEENRKLELEIEKEEILMENMEKNHKEEINAFVNKYKHLEYDHDVFINDILKNNQIEATKNEEEIRSKREKQFIDKKIELKNRIRETTDTNRKDIEKLQNNLENLYNRTKEKLDRKLNDISASYKIKMKELEDDLELRLKVEIHELEERKNLHINNLIRAFEDRTNSWKKENIDQIKENINLIKTNNYNLKSLISDNDSLEKEVKSLKTEIEDLEKKLKAAEQEHLEVTNRLKKYYNQSINIENMQIKITSLKKKCEETVNKTFDLEKKKEKLNGEIIDLKNKFVEAVTKFRARTELKNNLLEQHIEKLNEKFIKREIEIESILKEVDVVAGMNGSESGFGRNIIIDILEHVKTSLSAKSEIIKNLKFSLALATKVI
jgi:growth arrest-specific protein 8